MDRLRSLEVYVSVVETGSFSQAAQLLDMSAVMVGKYVAALEQQLHSRLIERSTRRHQITEAGQLFYQQAKLTLAQWQATFLAVERFHTAPQGLLRVSAPPSFGAAVVAPIAARFQNQHPLLQVDLDLSNRRVDLLAEAVDVAVRIGAVVDESVVAQYLCEYRMVMAASPTYLHTHGTPRQVEDLSQHRLLSHQLWHPIDLQHHPHLHALQTWQQHAPFHCNDGHALTAAALADAGIIIQPEVLLRAELLTGRLVVVLPEVVLPSQKVQVLYAPHNKTVAKTRLFCDFLQQEFGHYLLSQS